MNFLQTSSLQNLDLLLVGITIAAIGIFGFVVLLNNRRSITNQTFFLFAIITIAYGFFNYISYQLTNPLLVLWFIRATIFFAVWHAFAFFQLAYVFPYRQKEIPWHYKYLVVPVTVITSLATLTPFVFPQVQLAPTDQVSQPIVGPGIALFGGTVLLLILNGIFFLAKKMLSAKGLEKHQLQIVATGTFITLSFLLIFNFVFPAFLKNVSLIPLAPVFFLPFILLSSYAIIRYKFLDIKVLATEILTFMLAVVTLLEVLFARDIKAVLFRVLIFMAVLGFGILLIRSVRKEVEQREQLQKLTDDLERANAELKRLDRAKSEFISIASHQLRTPLTAMKGYLSLILDANYGELAQELKKPVAKVYQSNERLISLVNDLLSLSRIESGKMKLEPKETDIEGTIQSVIEELRIKADQKGLKLALVKPQVKLPKMMLDPEKMRNTILNVIDNSIRYTNKGSITVKLEPQSKKLRITVTDTGEGMTQEEIKDLFASFSRGEAGEKLSTEGVGLGLYIAKQFVKMHKGRIWADSPGKGRGSTFYVELPIA